MPPAISGRTFWGSKESGTARRLNAMVRTSRPPISAVISSSESAVERRTRAALPSIQRALAIERDPQVAALRQAQQATQHAALRFLHVGLQLQKIVVWAIGDLDGGGAGVAFKLLHLQRRGHAIGDLPKLCLRLERQRGRLAQDRRRQGHAIDRQPAQIDGDRQLGDQRARLLGFLRLLRRRRARHVDGRPPSAHPLAGGRPARLTATTTKRRDRPLPRRRHDPTGEDRPAACRTAPALRSRRDEPRSSCLPSLRQSAPAAESRAYPVCSTANSPATSASRMPTTDRPMVSAMRYRRCIRRPARC